MLNKCHLEAFKCYLGDVVMSSKPIIVLVLTVFYLGTGCKKNTNQSVQSTDELSQDLSTINKQPREGAKYEMDSISGKSSLIIDLGRKPQDPIKLYPKNDVGNNDDLLEFEKEMRGVIQRKDHLNLKKYLHRDVQTFFDGKNTIEEFFEYWHPEREDSNLWKLLENLLNLGGVWSDDQDEFYAFVFPYINNIELQNADDYSIVLVTTTPKAQILSKPNIESALVETLDYDVLYYDSEKSIPYQNESEIEGVIEMYPKQWYYVSKMDSTKSGYIHASHVRSPLDYRMYITKQSGDWKISCLIAGD